MGILSHTQQSCPGPTLCLLFHLFPKPGEHLYPATTSHLIRDLICPNTRTSEETGGGLFPQLSIPTPHSLAEKEKCSNKPKHSPVLSLVNMLRRKPNFDQLSTQKKKNKFYDLFIDFMSNFQMCEILPMFYLPFRCCYVQSPWGHKKY